MADIENILTVGELFNFDIENKVIDWYLIVVQLDYRNIGPGGLRAPCVLACAMRSLAIVITIVQSLFLSFSFFSPFFAFENSHVRNNFSPNILA